MPTNKIRYRCIECRGRFIRSKMFPVIVRVGWEKVIKWQCFQCPDKNRSKKNKK